MKIAILIHGFNVRDGGQATIGQLQTFYEAQGVPCIVFNYHWLGVFGTYRKNSAIAKRVSDAAVNAVLSGNEVIAVGHSNGCAILHEATARYRAPIKRLAYINPAVDKDKSPGSPVER